MKTTNSDNKIIKLIRWISLIIGLLLCGMVIFFQIYTSIVWIGIGLVILLNCILYFIMMMKTNHFSSKLKNIREMNLSEKLGLAQIIFYICFPVFAVFVFLNRLTIYSDVQIPFFDHPLTLVITCLIGICAAAAFTYIRKKSKLLNHKKDENESLNKSIK